MPLFRQNNLRGKSVNEATAAGANEEEKQILHSKGVSRVIPQRTDENPYFKWPKTTQADAYRYKMVNRETRKAQTSLDKSNFIKKNELKEYKNA